MDLMERPAVRWPEGPDWRGATVAILASGPSLSTAQVEQVRAWRAAGGDRRVIAINTTYLLAPWADMLYACDDEWWDRYIAEVREVFTGELWTQDLPTATTHHINWVRSERGVGLGRKPGVINQGGNSGFQAINLAFQAGATRLLLLGYDMQPTAGRSHWHADHPGTLQNDHPYPAWLADMRKLADGLTDEGVSVINCSAQTALRCFDRESLDVALSWPTEART